MNSKRHIKPSVPPWNKISKVYAHFCETALSDTNRQIEHFIPKMLTSPLEEIYKRYDNQPHTELDDFKNAELSPAEGRLPIFVTLRRLFFAEYR